MSSSKATDRIRVGIGGWTYEPWRDNFYPADLPQKQELHYASRQVTAIEVNGTYYSTMKPESFRKWHDETPEGFVFSLKATRYATNRKLLASAGESVARFVDSGITELKDKLGRSSGSSCRRRSSTRRISQPSWRCCPPRRAAIRCAM